MSLITPQEIIDYTVFKKVKARAPQLLQMDILQAETEVFEEVGHDFSDSTLYPVPPAARLALIQLAQYYALVNGDESIAKGIKSESIGGYSYTLDNGQIISKASILAMLRKFKAQPVQGNVNMRMRLL
ncbi:hypothetical protein BS614_04220 [Paenibacillus xylanexedens]|uniref:protein YqbG n=1 Tax=Paenibacillus xylanexedens TaxID=528191 RepID=UPI00093863EF|nr:DUF3199 family protein [Paenibacillus xylanexedens]APO43337.1 hypothetical protein BS614_04220 [Paenibacillus xylanexedens]